MKTIRSVRSALGPIALGTTLAFAAASCGSSDSGGGGGGGPTYTLDNVCSQIVPKICSMRQACCTSSGIGYDDAGCQANEMQNCQANVSDVNAGKMTFHPEDIDTCIAQIQPYFTECRVPITEIQNVLSALVPCRQVFAGMLAEGATCDRDDQCTPPTDASSTLNCTNGACKKSSLSSAGGACSFAQGASTLCASGLYCDIASGQTDGTCKTATALGAACTNPLECGLGAYCDSTTKVCTAGKAAGSACTNGLECTSLSCGSDGKCTDVAPFAKDLDCKGTGGTDGGTNG